MDSTALLLFKKTIDLHGILNGISWDFERNSSGIFVSENGGRSKIAI